MGFLRRLVGSAPTETVNPWLLAPERQEAVLQIVGEGSYQKSLAALGGRQTSDGPSHTEFTASFVREPTNKYDVNAIMIDIDGRQVGYLSREDAVRYRPVLEWAATRGRPVMCRARLTGGWDNGGGHQGFFGIELRAGSPAETIFELLGDELAIRSDHPWQGWQIAFTGDSGFALAGVPLDRECAALIARRVGLDVQPQITKDVQLIVDCDPGRPSGAVLRAIGSGTAVITEAEFWTALGVAVEPLAAWAQSPSWQRH